MKPHDQADEASRVDGASFRLDWNAAAGQARQASFRRLRALGVGDDEEEAELRSSGAFGEGSRSVDDEPAALVYDSNLDPHLLATVRAGSRPARQLTFESRDLVLELEISGAGRLMGQLVPPQAAVVELRHRAGTTSLDTDELGCFHVQDMPPGPVSFRCQPADFAAQAVATSWIAL